MKIAFLAVAACGLCVAGGAAAAPTETLRAGAAKIEITPPLSTLRPGDRIRDPLFVRALMLRAGKQCAVLVGIDQGGIGNAIANDAIREAAKATGCDADSFVISATHTHSGSTQGLGAGEPNSKQIGAAIVAAVRRADERARPARIGYGTAHLDLNVNRDLFTAGRWTQGPNEQGESDKTLAVVALLDGNGLPIGVYMNYAMHPVNFYLSGVISGDFPSDASRYIEKRYGSDMVAIFAQGASGDQNPRLQRPYNNLIALRTGSPGAGDIRVTAPKPWLRSANERNAVTRMNQAMAAPVPPERQMAYAAAIDDTGELVASEGALLGETAINTMRFGMTKLSDAVAIGAAQRQIQCPGRDRLDRDDPVRENALPPYADGASVTIKLGLLRLGDIYLGWVNGEVYSGIASRLKREAPVSDLLVTTLANGMANSGYIYSNEAASHLTFQVIGSRLKPSCAEDAIVATELELIESLAR